MTHKFNALFAVACLLAGGYSTSAQAQAQAQVQAQAQAPTCATVEVHNVRPQQGYLMLAAYADEASFGKKPLTALRVAAAGAITTFELCGLAGTEVAVSMFQDLDSDGKMGQNLLGMPLEPWGSSGTPGMFGPSWATGKVALNGGKIVVKLSV
jgi:uncharacterized protein (DUF2141 family)